LQGLGKAAQETLLGTDKEIWRESAGNQRQDVFSYSKLRRGGGCGLWFRSETVTCNSVNLGAEIVFKYSTVQYHDCNFFSRTYVDFSKNISQANWH